MALPEAKRARVLLRLSKHIQVDLLSKLSNDDLVPILNHLDPDEVTDIVQLLPRKRQTKVIHEFSDELKKSVQILSQFDPQTAAGLMNLDYIQVDLDEKIEEVSKQVKKHEKRTGRLPVIIVVDEDQILGFLPGHALGISRKSNKVKKHIHKILSIHHDATHDEVVQFFRNHPHNKIVVTGNKGNIIGIIYSDDVLRALKVQEASALYDFAGVDDEESITDSARQKIKHRYKWLVINLGTAFLASFTVGMFDQTISKYVLLAVYMPIVAGMGGNAGTQTLAVLVRGIALNQIELKTAWPTMRRELLSSLVNGIINGIIVAAIVILFNQNYKMALVLGLAMIINLIVAGFFGTFVPLLMKRLGKDPATSATIFITTATDVLGFVVFLGLATLVL